MATQGTATHKDERGVAKTVFLKDVLEGRQCRLNGFTLKRISTGSFEVIDVKDPSKTTVRIGSVYPLSNKNENVRVVMV